MYKFRTIVVIRKIVSSKKTILLKFKYSKFVK